MAAYEYMSLDVEGGVVVSVDSPQNGWKQIIWGSGNDDLVGQRIATAMNVLVDRGWEECQGMTSSSGDHGPNPGRRTIVFRHPRE